MLVAFAARLRPQDVEEFTSRPRAVDYVDGLMELQRRIEGLTVDNHLAFMTRPAEMMRPWKPRIDEKVMDGAAAAIHYMTEACTRADSATGL